MDRVQVKDRGSTWPVPGFLKLLTGMIFSERNVHKSQQEKQSRMVRSINQQSYSECPDS